MRFLRRALAVTLVLGAAVANASDFSFIVSPNQLICAAGGSACVRGSLSYSANQRIVELRSRVTQASGPGMFRIWLYGENYQGYPRRAVLEVPIRGVRSEIVNLRIIPDAPDVEVWVIQSVEFERESNRR
ncbi:MAG: hypothetical protein AAFN78_04160 [Pseudomonadota bacterium]